MCSLLPIHSAPMKIISKPYGSLPSGQSATLFTLSNSNGLSAEITNYGGIVVSLNVPNRTGKLTDVLLGKPDLQGYLDGHPHFACITGRVAGRIGGASFEIEGQTYDLEANNGPNALHGGSKGFHQILWDAEIVESDGIQKLKLSTTDPDGSNGYPGTIECQVTYALLEDNALEITYHANTDKTTPFNITNHAYFNLDEEGSGDVLNHEVQILSEAIAAVDENSTLTGVREPVVAGFNDYRQPVQLGDLDELLVSNADIHFFLEGGRTAEPRLAARVKSRKSGCVMEVFTTEPGVQFYAGLCLGGESGKHGHSYADKDGLCLETQDYADSVHFPEMGGAVLKPGDTFQSTTIYRFSAEA